MFNYSGNDPVLKLMAEFAAKLSPGWEHNVTDFSWSSSQGNSDYLKNQHDDLAINPELTFSVQSFLEAHGNDASLLDNAPDPGSVSSLKALGESLGKALLLPNPLNFTIDFSAPFVLSEDLVNRVLGATNASHLRYRFSQSWIPQFKRATDYRSITFQEQLKFNFLSLNPDKLDFANRKESGYSMPTKMRLVRTYLDFARIRCEVVQYCFQMWEKLRRAHPCELSLGVEKNQPIPSSVMTALLEEHSTSYLSFMTKLSQSLFSFWQECLECKKLESYLWHGKAPRLTFFSSEKLKCLGENVHFRGDLYSSITDGVLGDVEFNRTHHQDIIQRITKAENQFVNHRQRIDRAVGQLLKQSPLLLLFASGILKIYIPTQSEVPFDFVGLGPETSLDFMTKRHLFPRLWTYYSAELSETMIDEGSSQAAEDISSSSSKETLERSEQSVMH